MSVTFYTGQKALLRPRLMEALRAELRTSEDHALIVLVPEQLTLETEILALRELDLTGSFQLNIMSPKRLCARIFDEAGRLDHTVIDERGRAMLMGHVLRTLSGQLKWYSSARERRGFESRIVEEVIRFKQAGVTPEALQAQADAEEEGALKWKLNDLAALYAAYEKALEGRFQDGEDEIDEAIRRLPRARSLKDASVFVFGFDITTPIYNLYFASLARVCRAVNVFLSLENDGKARDFSIYQPLQASFERLVRAVMEAGVEWRREKLTDNEKPKNAAAHFAREIFCSPTVPFEGKNTCVQLAALNSPMEEARFAAALIRSLVRRRNWRYSDVMLLCGNIAGYLDAIESAFSAYDVPVFAPESRAADRHPLPRFLLESLKLAAGTGGNLATLLLTGYADASDEEADRLLSYVTSHSIKPHALLRAFRKGDPALLAAVEPVRRRVMEPIAALREGVTKAEDLKAQLTAIFEYMEKLDLNAKGEKTRQRLIELDKRALAAEDAQVWNRVMGTLDQMYTLMGDRPIPRAQIADLLGRAFASTQIKPLPQSQDAVNAVSAARAGSMPVKALIVIGAVSGADGGDNGLFAGPETAHLSEKLNCFLGADALARTRTDRMYMKNALAMAENYLCVTYPMSSSEGAAVTSGVLVQELRRVFPDIQTRGGVTGDEGLEALRFGALKAAAETAAVELSEGTLSESGRAALAVLAGAEGDPLTALSGALSQRVGSEEMGKELSRRVYGPMKKVSVTRLEAFAGCPFAHFVKYALRPGEEEVYGLNARDEGSFYHEAVRTFLDGGKSALAALSPEEAVARMNAISDALLEGAIRDVIEDSHTARASARRMRRTAARAARALNEQLEGSSFQPLELEMDFGDDSVNLVLNTGADTRLGGRIDRIDAMEEGGQKYLRVIDYKRGAQKLDAREMYYGLQLQLILYLAEALKKYGGKSAGAFYFRVIDPVINTESLDEEEIEQERSDRLRMEGLLPRENEVLKRMAAVPQRVFKMHFLKNGDLSSQDPAASEREFGLLISRAVEKATEISSAILRGVTEIEPVKTEKRDVCRFCDYKGVCMRDKQIPGGKPRRLKRMTFDEVYEKLEKREVEP